MTTILKETHARTVVKTISWRVLLTLSHIINGLIVSGSLLIGLQIAGLSAIINSILFWAHERAWNIFLWNRKQTDKDFVEGHPRTLSKIITWRVLITGSNFLIPFIMTGSWGAAAAFLGIATFVNIALFWGHERAWNKIHWGKKADVPPTE